MRDHVIYESRLELSRLLFADFDSSVRGIVAQPFLLKTVLEGKVRRHIPDYLLLTREVPVVVDVKPLHRLSKPEVAFTFGWTRRDCVLSCDVCLVVLDDLHFLKWGQKSGIEVSNHLKWIANEFPVMLLMVGVELAKKGLFGEGTNGRDTALAQTGRRTTRLGLRPFTIDAEAGRREWRQMLLALEQRVVLTDKHPGMLADDLSDYLVARSTGHIGSLMTLINRGCQRAVRTGAERLDQELVDRVKNDEASEAARLELQAALDKKRLTSRPRSRGRRAA